MTFLLYFGNLYITLYVINVDGKIQHHHNDTNHVGNSFSSPDISYRRRSNNNSGTTKGQG
jgi:hypothetical protein